MQVPICLFLSGAVLTAAQFKPVAQGSIVPSGSEPELVWAEGKFTEGPTLGTKGVIIFSDIGQIVIVKASSRKIDKIQLYPRKEE